MHRRERGQHVCSGQTHLPRALDLPDLSMDSCMVMATLMGGTKHTQVGVCRGAGVRGTGGWMLALLARLIGSPVPAWAQTVPILDESMHPSLGVRLVFPCRPLPPPPALLAIGE